MSWLQYVLHWTRFFFAVGQARSLHPEIPVPTPSHKSSSSEDPLAEVSWESKRYLSLLEALPEGESMTVVSGAPDTRPARPASQWFAMSSAFFATSFRTALNGSSSNTSPASPAGVKSKNAIRHALDEYLSHKYTITQWDTVPRYSQMHECSLNEWLLDKLHRHTLPIHNVLHYHWSLHYTTTAHIQFHARVNNDIKRWMCSVYKLQYWYTTFIAWMAAAVFQWNGITHMFACRQLHCCNRCSINTISHNHAMQHTMKCTFG